MAECDDLQQSLTATESNISRVERALDATTDPDEARTLAGELGTLQSQRTQLRILINQKCPASTTFFGLAGRPPKPDLEKLLADSKDTVESNRKLLAIHAPPARKSKRKRAAPKKRP